LPHSRIGSTGPIFIQVAHWGIGIDNASIRETGNRDGLFLIRELGQRDRSLLISTMGFWLTKLADPPMRLEWINTYEFGGWSVREIPEYANRQFERQAGQPSGDD
jgi:hypothetical protein